MPADTCGFTTLESLDAFGSLDSLNFSLDSGIWATACIKYGEGDVASNTNVTADGIRFAGGSADIASTATVTGDGIRIQFGDSDITSSATVTANGALLIDGSADIICSAEIEANGGIVASGESNVTVYADVYAFPTGIYYRSADISCSSSMNVEGYILGDEWTVVPPGNETWNLIN